MTPCVFYVVSMDESKLLPLGKKKLLAMANTATEAKMRWNLALALPKLPLTVSERAAASEILFEYLDDKSSLVKTFAMQGLADFAMQDKTMMAAVLPAIEHLTETGTAAMRARGRILLKRFAAARRQPGSGRGGRLRGE